MSQSSITNDNQSLPAKNVPFRSSIPVWSGGSNIRSNMGKQMEITTKTATSDNVIPTKLPISFPIPPPLPPPPPSVAEAAVASISSSLATISLNKNIQLLDDVPTTTTKTSPPPLPPSNETVQLPMSLEKTIYLRKKHSYLGTLLLLLYEPTQYRASCELSNITIATYLYQWEESKKNMACTSLTLSV